MKIYCIVDDYGDDGANDIWDMKFYSTLELAEEQLIKIVTYKTGVAHRMHEKKVAKWKQDYDAVRALRTVGVPVPVGLGWISSSPPEEKAYVSHYSIEEFEVIENGD